MQKLFLIGFIIISLSSCKSEQRIEILPTYPQGENNAEVDTIYSSIYDLLEDKTQFTSIHNYLEVNDWHLTEIDLISYLLPADTFYHQLDNSERDWKFQFTGTWPPDIYSGKITVSDKTSEFSFSFDLQADSLEFNNTSEAINIERGHFSFHNIIYYKDSSYSLQLKNNLKINDTTRSVNILKLQSDNP